MSIFSAIKDKIFGHRKTAAPQAPSATDHGAPAVATAPAMTQAPSAPPPQVDVEAVLASMAQMQDGGGGNYRSSIVDLLKLLHMDSSLEARKQLAQELGVHAGEPGSAEQNQALHRAVMKKLADNGGVVPDSFYS